MTLTYVAKGYRHRRVAAVCQPAVAKRWYVPLLVSPCGKGQGRKEGERRKGKGSLEEVKEKDALTRQRGRKKRDTRKHRRLQSPRQSCLPFPLLLRRREKGFEGVVVLETTGRLVGQSSLAKTKPIRRPHRSLTEPLPIRPQYKKTG